MGCRGMRRQANKASKGPDDQSGHGFPPYGRGNFPKRHVWRIIAKSAYIHADGYLWVCIGVVGCEGTGGHRNKGKRATNRSTEHVFALHGQGQTQGELYNEGNGRQKESWGRIMGK